MSALLQVDFAIGPLGSPVLDDFMTPESLRVVLPRPSTIKPAGHRTGIGVDEWIGLLPPFEVDMLVITAFAGANAPSARAFSVDGHLLASIQGVKQPNGTVVIGIRDVGPIDWLELHYTNGEGVICSLSAFSSVAVATPFSPLYGKQITDIDTSVCQAIVYAETGTIETTPAGLPGLAGARQFIAAVAYKRNGSGVAKPKYPTPDELKQPFIKRAWDRCKVAADDAIGVDVANCRHFVVWYSDDGGKTPSKKPSEITDKWPYNHSDKITQSWGPYSVNELGGDNIYVMKYCGVP